MATPKTRIDFAIEHIEKDNVELARELKELKRALDEFGYTELCGTCDEKEVLSAKSRRESKTARVHIS